MNTVKGNSRTQWLSTTKVTPEWINVKRTGGTAVTDTYAYTQSQEVDITDQGALQVPTEVSVAGSVEGEMHIIDPADQLMWSSVMRNPTTTSVISATVSFASGVMTDDALGGAFANLQVGSFVVPKGATLNGSTIFKVSAKADDDTVTLVPTPSDESAQAISFTMKEVRNGTTTQDLHFQERVPTDTDTLYNTFEDIRVTATTFTAATSSILTMSNSIMGFERLDQDTQVTGSTDATEVNSNILGSVNGVAGFFIDDAFVTRGTTCFTDYTCTIDTGANAEYALGGKGACSISQSAYVVTGSLTSFASSASAADYQVEKDKQRNETKFAMAAVFKDVDNNYLVISTPSVVYTALDQSELANGTTVMNTGTYSADGKSGTGYTVQISVITA